MILPDYEFPDSPEGRSQSPSNMLWRDPNVDQLDFQLPGSSSFGSKYASPTTPIIYGNGTMLSDIGEVTEVESTVGPASRRASSRYSAYTENETFGPAVAVSNKVAQRRSKVAARDRERRYSNDSTSTITTQDHRATFGDFDDSVSVGDSSFQGDDEESMASSYVEGTIPRSARIRESKMDEANGDYSTSYISNRAEQILANAKRRLTVGSPDVLFAYKFAQLTLLQAMEGNLNRARSSLGYSDGSTPSPQLGRPGSALRESAGTSQPTSHSRIKSEDGIRDISNRPTLFPQRSASALGAAGGYRQPTSRFRRDDAGSRTGHSAYGNHHHPLDSTLEPLSEDDARDSASNTDSRRSSAQYFNLLSPTFGTFSDRGLTRSASVAQMRDIQDQMQGLRGKISTLKEQARADSLKRRSLQSLRTPSPFTHARFDQGLMEPREIRTSVHSQDGMPTSPYVVEEDGREGGGHAAHEVAVGDGHGATEVEHNSSGSERHRSVSSPRDRATPTQSHAAAENNPEDVVEDGADDLRTENGDVSDEEYGTDQFDDAQSDMREWESESGESTYHDSQQHQMSHEDREDAFDYEHFFLHSALGSISRRGQRDSSESEFSDDSVETTRGPTSRSSRRRSIDTLASDDTFATATEGRASRSSAVKADMGGYNDGGYDELPPVQEVRSNDGTESPYEGQEARQRQNSVVYRPTSAAQADRLHRPSVSSFESTGTNRSFPLVNKAKLNGGVLTPGGSPDLVVRQLSETLMNGTSGAPQGTKSGLTLQGLHKDDQIAVERLVASLGKCVLSLGEASKASTESRMIRRRLDEARRILEGHDEA
jgi:hypothetical protein